MRVIVHPTHPSGDPGPSAEGVHVTRQIVKVGALQAIDVLNRPLMAQRCFTLKEPGLGLDGGAQNAPVAG